MDYTEPLKAEHICLVLFQKSLPTNFTVKIIYFKTLDVESGIITIRQQNLFWFFNVTVILLLNQFHPLFCQFLR